MKVVQGIGRIQSREWGVPTWALLSQGPCWLTNPVCRRTWKAASVLSNCAMYINTCQKNRPLISSHLRLCWIRMEMRVQKLDVTHKETGEQPWRYRCQVWQELYSAWHFLWLDSNSGCPLQQREPTLPPRHAVTASFAATLPKFVNEWNGICFCFSALKLFAFWPSLWIGGMGRCIQRAGPWAERQEMEELLFLIIIQVFPIPWPVWHPPVPDYSKALRT